MIAGALLALAAIVAAIANHARLRWTSPTPMPSDDWSRRWTWLFAAAALAIGGAVGAHCGGAP